MKKSLAIALLSFPIFAFSQKQMGNFAHVTTNKDTLFLLKDDTMSKLTFNIWKSDPTWNGQNPYIVFVDAESMEDLKFAYQQTTIEFVRMRKTPIKTKNK